MLTDDCHAFWSEADKPMAGSASDPKTPLLDVSPGSGLRAFAVEDPKMGVIFPCADRILQ